MSGSDGFADYAKTVERFERIVRDRRRDDVMAALIVDSPWLPGYGGVNTIDFCFEAETWLDVYKRVRRDLPGAVFVPDVWVEFGMAAEPSGFGAALEWSADTPPAIHPFPGGIDGLLAADLPDPERHGLMPAILRRYERMKPRLDALGFAPRMAAARGPLAVAAHLVGVTELLMATQLERSKCDALFDRTTELCIRWLRAQLDRMDEPMGVLVLDDLVGMMSPADSEHFATGRLKRIFDAFPGLIRIFHNDTPNKAVYPAIADIGVDVFNFSHEVSVEEARGLVGPEVVLMGNVPPLDVLTRGTPDDVRVTAKDLLAKADEFGPLLISPGGGVPPGAPLGNVKAMVETIPG
jgi:uroporphyrinogen decarboxylase